VNLDFNFNVNFVQINNLSEIDLNVNFFRYIKGNDKSSRIWRCVLINIIKEKRKIQKKTVSRKIFNYNLYICCNINYFADIPKRDYW